MVDTRAFGQTGLTVTPIGLGLAALGRPGYINLGHGRDLEGSTDLDAMRAHSHDVLDAAWALGIRYFDAARSYGRAEAFLAAWLESRAIAPEEVTVGSKWGYIYTADWRVNAETHEVKEHTLTNLNRQWEESRSLLAPYMRLYQIHSATPESGVLENREVLERLGELRDRGLTIGLSTSGPTQADTVRRALDIVIGGRRLFGSVQATWNLLAQEAGPALEAAHAAGLGVLIKEALANGRLTTRNNDPDFAAKRLRLESAAEAHGTTMDALALAGVLAQPWAGCVLSGATTTGQLASNVRAVDVEWTAELATLAADLVESPRDYWSQRSDLAWN